MIANSRGRGLVGAVGSNGAASTLFRSRVSSRVAVAWSSVARTPASSWEMSVRSLTRAVSSNDCSRVNNSALLSSAISHLELVDATLELGGAFLDRTLDRGQLRVGLRPDVVEVRLRPPR